MSHNQTSSHDGIIGQSLSPVDGKSVLYGEDGIAGNINPWEGSNDGSSLFDEDDMKDLYRLMGYNCDPASAYEQTLYMTFGSATMPFRK